MRKYLVSFRQSFVDVLAYGPTSLVWSLIGMLGLIVPLVIWSVATPLGDTFGGYTRSQMLAYYSLIVIVGNFVIWYMEYSVSSNIREGNLSNYLVKPFPFLMAIVSTESSWKLLRFIIQIPIFLLVVHLVKPEFDLLQPLTMLSAILSVLIGSLLGLLISLCFGLLSFWVTDTSGFTGLYYFASYILSGELAPLSIYPSWFKNIAFALPYRYVLSFPIETLMGKLGPDQILAGHLIQITWVVAVILLLRFLWKKGLSTYQAYGK